MNIYIVGMHNKPGTKPLDSKTRSGMLVDALIERISTMFNYETVTIGKIVKSNACDLDYLPTDDLQIFDQIKNWHEKHQPKKTDIIILLGAWVQKNFFNTDSNIVKLRHPGRCLGKVAQREFLNDACLQIIKLGLYVNQSTTSA